MSPGGWPIPPSCRRSPMWGSYPTTREKEREEREEEEEGKVCIMDRKVADCNNNINSSKRDTVYQCTG